MAISSNARIINGSGCCGVRFAPALPLVGPARALAALRIRQLLSQVHFQSTKTPTTMLKFTIPHCLSNFASTKHCNFRR
jgi:hypothetical protein